MIPAFNVLDRSQDMHASYLLEASAGTGKTYSIENIVVRLLMDQDHPCLLKDILIVTFTKASTSDLKIRIRTNIHRILSFLNGSSSESPPDYVEALLEAEASRQSYAKKQLEQALSAFEQASIFTIHGFCHRMLREYLFEANIGAVLGENETGISQSLINRLIRDFFRTEISEELISYEQLKRVIHHCGSIEKLEKELFKLATKGMAIAPLPTLREYFSQFCENLKALKKSLGAFSKSPSMNELLQDFELQAPLYKEICNRQKKPKPENIAKVQRFAALLEKDAWDLADFDMLIADGVYLADALHPANLGSKKMPLPPENLHCPELIDLLNRFIVPIVTEARNPHYLLSTLASRCQEMVAAYLKKKEIVGFDDLLKGLHTALQEKEFAEKIRQRFSTAIIDEFQDTDPIQWEIFKKIYLPADEPQGRLYLVGDPKQSIYGFRQADIYTYLTAGNALGTSSKASLDTNYRSIPPLVEALNALFSTERVPELLALPRLNKTLTYAPVKSGISEDLATLNDGRGAIHFFSYQETGNKGSKLEEAEESYFLPFISSELLSMQSLGVSLNKCAILVADRFQAARLQRHLKKHSIPIVAQHTESLTSTLAFNAMAELLQAILTPQRESALKIALGGPLIGWTKEEIQTLEDPFLLESMIAQGLFLRKIWVEKGFSAFYQSLLTSSWHANTSNVAETILQKEEGLTLFHCLQQLAELLIERETIGKLSPHSLLNALKEMQLLETIGDESIKQRMNPEKEGVRILTIHSSKGLEFECVFALGIIKRSQPPSHFIPIIKEGFSPLLTAVLNSEDPRYVQYALELDAEKMRLLYVAFTRAKQRLYIPVHFQTSGKKYSIGTASPIELYLTMMMRPDVPFADLYNFLPEVNAPSLRAQLQTLGTTQSITASTNEESNKRLQSESVSGVSVIPETRALFHPKVPLIMGNPCFIHSFTGLSALKSDELIPDLELNTQIELKPPSDFDCENQTSHTLPAGNLTGILLHSIMENISFTISESELFLYVEKCVSGTPFEKWTAVIAKMVEKAVSVKLPTGQSDVCLKELKPNHHYREHEFLYEGSTEIHSELAHRPGYIQGVIDLIFEHEGKYFLIDWKTNWLGTDSTFYEPDHMKSAMHLHQYFLQAYIYKEALRRYLKLVDERPFEEIYGGTFYIFIRGLEENNYTGIYLSD